jgi:hypothetical protein
LDGNVGVDELNVGMKPGHIRALGSFESTDYDSSEYEMALESQEPGDTENYESSLLRSVSSSAGQQTSY